MDATIIQALKGPVSLRNKQLSRKVCASMQLYLLAEVVDSTHAVDRSAGELVNCTRITAGTKGIFYQKSIQFLQPGHYGLRFTLVAPADDFPEDDDSTNDDTKHGNDDENDSDADNSDSDADNSDSDVDNSDSDVDNSNSDDSDNSDSSDCGDDGVRVRGIDKDVYDWAQCEVCELWRVLERPLAEGAHFQCSDIGRQCLQPTELETRLVEEHKHQQHGRAKRSLNERGKGGDNGPSPKFPRVGKRQRKWNVEPHYTVVRHPVSR